VEFVLVVVAVEGQAAGAVVQGLAVVGHVQHRGRLFAVRFSADHWARNQSVYRIELS
jgi:hypothetical protein